MSDNIVEQDNAIKVYELIDEIAGMKGGPERGYMTEKLVHFMALLDVIQVGPCLDYAKKEAGINMTYLREAIKIEQEKSNDIELIPDDSDLALTWKDEHQDVRYGLGRWREYENGHWPEIDDAIVDKSIFNICRRARKEFGISVSHGRADSVKGHAQTLSRLNSDDTWNGNEDIFVLRNGTFNLSTMQFREHRKEDYSTRAVDYDYNSDASCVWFNVALDALEDDVKDFLQEFAGYCLTTDTSHEIAIWLHGVPGSGKSTVIKGFEVLLGDYAGLLGLSQIERSQFALSSLPGKRLVTCTESPGTYFKSTPVLNAIISGERITVEQKYEDAYEVELCTKMLWSMNDLPRIGSANDGIFRRIKVIEFEQGAIATKDTELKDKIANEGSGIFNWSLEGLKRLMERGHFEVPDSVKEWSEDFKSTNDKTKLFIEECCEVDLGNGDFNVGATDLYNAYRAWCRQNGFEPLNRNNLYAEWKRFGFDRYQRSGYYRYRFVKLLPQKVDWSKV